MLSINIADVIAVLQTMIPQLVIIGAVLCKKAGMACILPGTYHYSYQYFTGTRLLNGQHGHGWRNHFREIL